MKKYFILIAFSLLLLTQMLTHSLAEEFKIKEDISTWETYRNKKYGYEIQYPKSLKIWLTGLESERDGKRFKIVYEHVSMLHGFWAEVNPNKTLHQLAMKHKAPDLETLSKDSRERSYSDEYGQYIQKWSKVTINGQDAIKGEYYRNQKDSQQLLHMTFILDGAIFKFIGAFGDFDALMAEEIVVSFKFYRK